MMDVIYTPHEMTSQLSGQDYIKILQPFTVGNKGDSESTEKFDWKPC